MFNNLTKRFGGKNPVNQEITYPNQATTIFNDNASANQDPQYILTDSDYLTLRLGEEMPLLGGVPTDTYLKMRLYKNYFIWGPMLEKLGRYHPNIQELHCMLSATRPMFVEVEYEDHTDYGAELEHEVLPRHRNTICRFSYH